MIYIHVPFCRSFCIYCGFYSEIACKENTSLLDKYINEVCDEASRRKEEIIKTSEINTLYIGGGTPSVMPLPFFEKIVESLPLSGFDEFTVEVNPDDILQNGQNYLRKLKDLGVNRISMGVQSLDDKILRWMNRRHDANCAIKAFEMIRSAGFDNVSLDIIFGIQNLNYSTLSDTIDRIIHLEPEHISAYQLSIDDNSSLDELVKKAKYTPCEDDICASQYNLICEKFNKAGYEHYEISNWAKPGKQAKHNSAYWDRKPYVGLGPGAHSFSIENDIQKRSWNTSSITNWKSECEILKAEEIREEIIMLGMRKKEGLVYNGKHLFIPEDKWFIADSLIAEAIE